MKSRLFFVELKYLILVICMSPVCVAMAQEEQNPRYPIYYGEVIYQSPSVMTSISGLLGVFDGDNGYHNISVEDQSMADGLAKAIQAGATKVYRLMVQQGAAPKSANAESYVLNIKMKNVMSGRNKYGKLASADAIYQLVNLQTGKEVASVKTGCNFSMCSTTAEAIAGLDRVMSEKTQKFLTACFPLTGSILQKDVEQSNGKVNEDQCYIDLGEKFGVYEKLKFEAYADEGGHLDKIGELKLKSTEGDEVSVCTITKGYDKIADALAKGQKVIIKTIEKMK